MSNHDSMISHDTFALNKLSLIRQDTSITDCRSISHLIAANDICCKTEILPWYETPIKLRQSINIPLEYHCIHCISIDKSFAIHTLSSTDTLSNVMKFLAVVCLICNSTDIFLVSNDEYEFIEISKKIVPFAKKIKFHHVSSYPESIKINYSSFRVLTELRYYQKDAYNVIDSLSPNESCVISLSPGSGESFIQLKYCIDHPEKIITIVVSTKYLMKQITELFEINSIDLDDESCNITIRLQDETNFTSDITFYDSSCRLSDKHSGIIFQQSPLYEINHKNYEYKLYSAIIDGHIPDYDITFTHLKYDAFVGSCQRCQYHSIIVYSDSKLPESVSEIPDDFIVGKQHAIVVSNVDILIGLDLPIVNTIFIVPPISRSSFIVVFGRLFKTHSAKRIVHIVLQNGTVFDTCIPTVLMELDQRLISELASKSYARFYPSEYAEKIDTYIIDKWTDITNRPFRSVLSDDDLYFIRVRFRYAYKKGIMGKHEYEIAIMSQDFQDLLSKHELSNLSNQDKWNITLRQAGKILWCTVCNGFRVGKFIDSRAFKHRHYELQDDELSFAIRSNEFQSRISMATKIHVLSPIEKWEIVKEYESVSCLPISVSTIYKDLAIGAFAKYRIDNFFKSGNMKVDEYTLALSTKIFSETTAVCTKYKQPCRKLSVIDKWIITLEFENTVDHVKSVDVFKNIPIRSFVYSRFKNKYQRGTMTDDEHEFASKSKTFIDFCNVYLSEINNHIIIDNNSQISEVDDISSIVSKSVGVGARLSPIEKWKIVFKFESIYKRVVKSTEIFDEINIGQFVRDRVRRIFNKGKMSRDELSFATKTKSFNTRIQQNTDMKSVISAAF